MKRIGILAGIMVIMLAAMPAAVWSYSGGSGTSGDPYQIATKADLKYLSEHSGEWSKHFKQTADITFADADFQSGGDFYNSGNGFIPIGNISTEFTGSYDGDGYTISNLFINRSGTDRVGFFGRTANGTTVEKICLTEVDITGNELTGGLVGQSYGTVSNACVTGSVAGASQVGGLVGQAESSTTTSDSYSTAAVSGTSYVGGLVGSFAASISKCYSTGDVSGTLYVGGLVGVIWDGSAVSNSYSKGDVTRTSGTQTSFGGFCGGVIIMGGDVTIQNCYSIGSVSCGSATDKGFVGGESEPSGTYTNNFFDSEASNQSTATGATAKNTAQMKTGSTFTDASWDFTNTWTISSSLNDGYPYLKNTPLVVDLVSFTATGFEDYVLLEWETASEIDNAGFHLWRSETEDGEYVRITDSLIPAEGSPTSGAEYEYEDLDVEQGLTYFYELEDIDYDGLSTFHGPVSATVGDEALVLLSPEDRASVSPFTPPTFEWEGEGLFRFKVGFSTDPHFTSKVIVLPTLSKRRNPWITEEFYMPTRREWRRIRRLGRKGRTVYWRVNGEDEAEEGFTSEALGFTIVGE